MKFSEIYKSFNECDETLKQINMQLRLIGEQTDLQQGLRELQDPQLFLLPLTNCSSSRTLSSGPCLNFTHSCRHKTPGHCVCVCVREREREGESI